MSSKLQPHDSRIVWSKDALEKGLTYGLICANRESAMQHAHKAHEASSIRYPNSAANQPPQPQPAATGVQSQTTSSNQQGAQDAAAVAP